jgi:hypothetical protein
MLNLFVIELIFQHRCRSSNDQYSRQGPLTPDGRRNRAKETTPEGITDNRKCDCLGIAQDEKFTVTESRGDGIVGLGKKKSLSRQQRDIRLDQENLP